MSRLDELLRMVETETDECIIWPGSPAEVRYGRISGGSRNAAPRLVHVIVCERYHGPRPPGMQARHYACGNTKCVNPRHLCWGTPQENVADNRRFGTWAHGERHGNCRLATSQVNEIRRRYEAHEANQYQLAAEFGVSQGHVSYIVRGAKRVEA